MKTSSAESATESLIVTPCRTSSA